MTILFNRINKLSDKLKHTSAFLFGPRQTGKTTLIKNEFNDTVIINLLKSEEFLNLSSDLIRLRSITKDASLVVIDEIQRLPELLNEVHFLIEERKTKFLLTGSSARKIRKGGVNLLGGRATTLRLHPLSIKEIGSDFNLDKSLNFGMLPSVWLSENPNELLSAYITNYLEMEIMSEAAVRNLSAFRRFLNYAALASGQQINYTKLSSDAQIKPTTLREHFEILIDSLIASRVETWKKGASRKVVSREKIYFFDTGVQRVLQERQVYTPKTKEYGEAFETLIFHELRCFSDYKSAEKISYWHTNRNLEVDFILGDRLAIEAKSSTSVSESDLKSLRAIKNEANFQSRIVVCNEPHERITEDGILIMPLNKFIEKLWADDFK